jgi:hypothetical protein
MTAKQIKETEAEAASVRMSAECSLDEKDDGGSLTRVVLDLNAELFTPLRGR